MKGNNPTMLSETTDGYEPVEKLDENKFSFGFIPDKRKFFTMPVEIDGEKYFQYFFQRRTESQTNWASTTNVGNRFIVTSRLSEAQAKLLTDLYTGETVVLTEAHDPEIGLVGKSVKMC